MSAPSTTDNRLAFAILGPLRVTRSGAVVALGGRQQRAILARLLVAGDVRLGNPELYCRVCQKV